MNQNPNHRRRVLITAGPTHEPIDAVRFLGNRSSGRMGIALARAASAAGHSVVLLLGPTSIPVDDSSVRVVRFRTASDLRELLAIESPNADVLVMAAAVADYRPKPLAALSGGKFRRSNEPVVLELEPTPDLLAEVSSRRLPGQRLVGFALEPRAAMLESALAKLERKKVDLVVANPLETMDSLEIEGVVVGPGGKAILPPRVSMPKAEFASWLVEVLMGRS